MRRTQSQDAPTSFMNGLPQLFQPVFRNTYGQDGCIACFAPRLEHGYQAVPLTCQAFTLCQGIDHTANNSNRVNIVQARLYVEVSINNLAVDLQLQVFIPDIPGLT